VSRPGGLLEWVAQAAEAAQLRGTPCVPKAQSPRTAWPRCHERRGPAGGRVAVRRTEGAPRVTDEPPAKVDAAWAHRAGAAPRRRWSSRAQRHLMAVEACGRQR
jgi:hypothetical protein